MEEDILKKTKYFDILKNNQNTNILMILPLM